MGVYDDDAAAALEMLAEFGTTLTITRRIPGDPGAGDRPPVAPVKIVATCQGLILPPKARRGLSADGVQRGALLASSMRILYIAGLGITLQVTGGTFTDVFEPAAEDTALLEGRTYTITGNDPLAPDGGTPILHRALVST